MKTNFPTVELFFGLAFTYCKVRVYEKDEAFAQCVLRAHRVEFLTSEDSDSWQQIDTRVLLGLVSEAIATVLPNILPQPTEVARQMAAAMGLRR